MREIAIDLLSVLAILSSMVLIPVLVILVIGIGIGIFKWATERMMQQADELSDYLYEKTKAKEVLLDSDKLKEMLSTEGDDVQKKK